MLGGNARRYLLENGGVAQVERFAAEVPEWQVRAFRPEEREEWQLAVDDPAAKVVRFEHSLREEAPGASLSVEEARRKAEAAVTATGFDIGTLVFKEAKTEKRPARLDHTFTWKDPSRTRRGRRVPARRHRAGRLGGRDVAPHQASRRRGSGRGRRRPWRTTHAWR